jgi:BMFP domain-containing protein YqiC
MIGEGAYPGDPHRADIEFHKFVHGNLFTVYTVQEIDGKLETLGAVLREVDARYAAAMGGLGAQVMRAVNEAMARMEGQLLTPAARERLTGEIAARLAGEVEARVAAAMRSEVAQLEVRLAALEARASNQ